MKKTRSKKSKTGIIAGFLIITCTMIHAQKNYSISQKELDKYTQLNDQETRLKEYKDDKNALLLKLNQLAHINASRQQHQKPPVQLDILASRVANKTAQEAARENFMGHFNLRGEKPYHRYAFAGGTAHVSENASALSSSDLLPSTPNDITKYMQQAHNAFMAEQAPNDGHKQNCIDTNHNYVGIGFSLHKEQFRYYEEFLDKYVTFNKTKSFYRKNETIKISIKPDHNKYLHMILVYYEPFPTAMRISSINKQMKYDDYTKDLVHKVLPWQLPQTNAEGISELEFSFDKKGLYYLQIYLDNTAFTTGKASTKNKIQASGIVIQVR